MNMRETAGMTNFRSCARALWEVGTFLNNIP